MTTLTTKPFNLQNWTGADVTVPYRVDHSSPKARALFSFYDYEFSVTRISESGWVLAGDDWDDDLEVLHADGMDAAVVAAVRWVAKCV